MLFFSRFGPISYLFIVLAAVLFFLIFYFFLSHGERILNNIKKSKILNFCVSFISMIFCASMFAGMCSLLSVFPLVFQVICFALITIFCFYVTRNDIGGLEKASVFMMPVVSVIFLCVLIFCSRNGGGICLIENSLAGAWFCPLYVALNCSLSGVVIASAGRNLTKKQTVLVSLFSSGLLLFFLLFGNFVLLSNLQSFASDMPFLYLAGDNPVVFFLMFFVILAGCFTTLISLCFALKNSVNKHIQSQNLSCCVAIFVPLVISLLGFSQIISTLYPICSVIGILCILFSVFSFD